MDYITAATMESLLSDCEQTPGENCVYQVIRKLDGAEAFPAYYEGISAGKYFRETIAGTDP